MLDQLDEILCQRRLAIRAENDAAGAGFRRLRDQVEVFLGFEYLVGIPPASE